MGDFNLGRDMATHVSPLPSLLLLYSYHFYTLWPFHSASSSTVSVNDTEVNEGVRMGLRTSIVDRGTLRPQSPRAQHQVTSLLAKSQILSPTGNPLVFLLGDLSLSPGPPNGPSLGVGLGPGGQPVSL